MFQLDIHSSVRCWQPSKTICSLTQWESFWGMMKESAFLLVYFQACGLTIGLSGEKLFHHYVPTMQKFVSHIFISWIINFEHKKLGLQMYKYLIIDCYIILCSSTELFTNKTNNNFNTNLNLDYNSQTLKDIFSVSTELVLISVFLPLNNLSTLVQLLLNYL